MSRNAWTQEARDKVAVHLREGLTASQIGSLFGVSRNAIIGIVARDKALKGIGFARPARCHNIPGVAVSSKKRRGERGGFVSKNRLKPVRKPVSAPTIVPASGGVSLADLGPRQCKFCINEPEQGMAAHLFCGEVTERGSSWCPHHEQIVWGKGTAGETETVQEAERIAA